MNDDEELVGNEERTAPSLKKEEQNSDNDNTRLRRSTVGQGIDRLEMSLTVKRILMDAIGNF